MYDVGIEPVISSLRKKIKTGICIYEEYKFVSCVFGNDKENYLFPILICL